MSRVSYSNAVQRSDVLSKLGEFDPHVAGTPPLGLDLPTSDIDVLCYAPDADRFASFLRAAFGSHAEFHIRQWSDGDRTVIATFVAEGWCFEIFGQAKPVAEQVAWRHFVLERRLLDLGGSRLANKVMAFRRAGMKTEPAFAAALNLPGDPSRALLEIEKCEDQALSRMIIYANK